MAELMTMLRTAGALLILCTALSLCVGAMKGKGSELPSAGPPAAAPPAAGASVAGSQGEQKVVDGQSGGAQGSTASKASPDAGVKQATQEIENGVATEDDEEEEDQSEKINDEEDEKSSHKLQDVDDNREMDEHDDEDDDDEGDAGRTEEEAEQVDEEDEEDEEEEEEEDAVAAGDGEPLQGKGSNEEDDNSSSSGSFVTYFITAVVLVVVLYIGFHNRHKIMAYIVEGRRARATGGRRRATGSGGASGTAVYRQLSNEPPADELLPPSS